jgi:hypothetical protein
MFSRTTVDVISIVNVPSRHAAEYSLQVKICPTLTTHRQHVEKQTGSTTFYFSSVVKMFQDLFRSDNVKVSGTLDALNHDPMKDNKIYDKLQAVGGCSALVHLMQNCLDKAIDEFPACDQVTELKECAEVTTLNKTLIVIIS